MDVGTYRMSALVTGESSVPATGDSVRAQRPEHYVAGEALLEGVDRLLAGMVGIVCRGGS